MAAPGDDGRGFDHVFVIMMENTGYDTLIGNQNVPFINLNCITMAHYATMSPAEIKEKYFTMAENTHTSPAGSERNALSVVEGLRELNDCPLAKYLVDKPAGVGAATGGDR